MAFPWLQAAGAGIQLAGGLMGARSQRRNMRKWRRKMESLLGQQEEQQRQQLGVRERLLHRNIAETEAGFTKAEKQTALGGVLAKQTLSGIVGNALGAVSQSMSARGLSGSSLADISKLGAAVGAGGALAGIDVGTADTLSHLAIGRAGAVGAARGALAEFQGIKGATLSDVIQSKSNFYNAYYGMKMQGVGSNAPAIAGLGGAITGIGAWQKYTKAIKKGGVSIDSAPEPLY